MRTVERVLVVDDEPVITLVLKDFLAAPGREIVTAGSLKEATELARTLPSLEVALLDKNLPDGCGFDIARTVREAHPDAQFILMTAYATLESAIEAVQVGAFDYVCKPFQDFSDLNRRIEKALVENRRKREQRLLIESILHEPRGPSPEQHEAVCQAARGVAHDFCNELTVILANAQVLLGRLEARDPRSQQVKGIISASERAVTLIHQLRAIIPKPKEIEQRKAG